MVRLFSTIDTVTNGPCIGLSFIKLFQKSQLTDVN